MTRREQIRANRKSLALLHVLECNQLIIGKSTLEKCRQSSVEADLSQPEVLSLTGSPWLACTCYISILKSIGIKKTFLRSVAEKYC
jgi:hypothetical protein